MEAQEYELMDVADETMWWYRALHARLVDALSSARGKLLDAGCGTGGFMAALRKHRPDFDVAGLEYDPVAAERAAAKSDAPVKQGSVNAIPFDDGAFDVVVSSDVLCHKAVDPILALKEMRRVLRPGGLLIINMPAFQWMHSAHDLHVHTHERITAGKLRSWFADTQFAGGRSWYWNGLLFPLVMIRRKLVASGSAAPSDVTAFPAWQDSLFFTATELERRLPFRMPFGSSVMGTATTP